MSLSIAIDDPLWSLFSDGEVKEQYQDAPRRNQARPCQHCGGESAGICLFEGNMVCMSCHTLTNRQLDYGAEWRSYGMEENPARCPSSSTVSAWSADSPQLLGSVVSWCPRTTSSYWGKKTEKSSDIIAQRTETGRQMQRNQMWSTRSYQDRVLGNVIKTMMVNLSHREMPNIILEEAKTIYNRLSKERITRGSSREGIIAASVYVACKRCDVPRSIREVADIFNIEMKVMTCALRLVDDIIGNDNDILGSEPHHFVGRFCSRLDLSEDIVEQVRNLVTTIDKESVIYNAMPTSIVAGVILCIVSKERRINQTARLPTNGEISSVCQVATTTMSKISKRIHADPATGPMVA